MFILLLKQTKNNKSYISSHKNFKNSYTETLSLFIKDYYTVVTITQ